MRSVLARGCRRQLLHNIAHCEACGLGPRRELPEALYVFRHDGLRRHEQESSVRVPVAVQHAVRSALERVGSHIVKHWSAQLYEVALPNAERSLGVNFGMLLHEANLP